MWEALLLPLTTTVIVWIGLVMDSVPLDARDWALAAIVTSNVLWVR